MAVPDEFSIPLSRIKMGAYPAFALFALSISIWVVVSNDPEIAARYIPEMAQAFGWLGTVLLGPITVYSIRKFFDRRPGLTFTAAGVTDNSSAIPSGFIPWSDIQGITTLKSRGTRYLVVMVKDPDKYWERGNLLQRWLRRRATGFGSPVALSAGLLAINFDGLTRLFEQYLKKYGRASASKGGTL